MYCDSALLTWLVAFIKIHIYKKISTEYRVNAEKALEYTNRVLRDQKLELAIYFAKHEQNKRDDTLKIYSGGGSKKKSRPKSIGNAKFVTGA